MLSAARCHHCTEAEKQAYSVQQRAIHIRVLLHSRYDGQTLQLDGVYAVTQDQKFGLELFYYKRLYESDAFNYLSQKM